MQLSQLYRRGVVRPLNDCAAKQLAAFRVDGPIRAEWIPILSDEQFADIWEAGVLQRLNDACGIEISDYEEVELKASKISRALQAVRTGPITGRSDSTFSRELEALLVEAMTMSQNVYFVF